MLAALQEGNPFPAKRPDAKTQEYATFVSSDGSGAFVCNTKGEIAMGDRGKKDKGNREKRKKPKLDIKERRKLRKDKDKSSSIPSTIPLTPPS
jgi:hypothetical protein